MYVYIVQASVPISAGTAISIDETSMFIFGNYDGTEYAEEITIE